MSNIVFGHEITDLERQGFDFDLTTGHHQRQLFDTEQAAMEALGSFLQQPPSIRGVQAAEDEFTDSFMTMSKQEVQVGERHFIYPTASQSIGVAANIFRLAKPPKNGSQHTARFVSPVFDNVPGLFAHHGFGNDFTEERPDFWSPKDDLEITESSLVKTDVLVLVSPNNPTGFRLTAPELKNLTEACESSNTGLCIDRSFLNQPEGYAFDMHKLLADSGVSYITIDDTGKLWATQELKLSILTTSPDLAKLGSDVHNLLQLSASSAVMRAFAGLARAGGALTDIRKLIADNRAVLMEAAGQSEVFAPAEAQYPPSELCVDLLKISGREESVVKTALGRLGVGVVSLGEFMFTSEPTDSSERDQAIRISLARDPAYIAGAAERISHLEL